MIRNGVYFPSLITGSNITFWAKVNKLTGGRLIELGLSIKLVDALISLVLFITFLPVGLTSREDYQDDFVVYFDDLRLFIGVAFFYGEATKLFLRVFFVFTARTFFSLFYFPSFSFILSYLGCEFFAIFDLETYLRFCS